jgi:hypothetical protein
MLANAAQGAPVLGLARIVRGWLLTLPDPDAALEDPALFPPAIRMNLKLRAAISAAIP